jgi:hypothetical protein
MFRCWERHLGLGREFEKHTPLAHAGIVRGLHAGQDGVIGARWRGHRPGGGRGKHQFVRR